MLRHNVQREHPRALLLLLGQLRLLVLLHELQSLVPLLLVEQREHLRLRLEHRIKGPRPPDRGRLDQGDFSPGLPPIIRNNPIATTTAFMCSPTNSTAMDQPMYRGIHAVQLLFGPRRGQVSAQLDLSRQVVGDGIDDRWRGRRRSRVVEVDHLNAFISCYNAGIVLVRGAAHARRRPASALDVFSRHV